MNDRLVIGTNGCVAAIDKGSGQELWRTKLGTGFFSATTYEDVSVIMEDATVFAGCNGHLFALDLSSGRILWHNELKGLGHNDVSMALDTVSVQYLQKVVRNSSKA